MCPPFFNGVLSFIHRQQMLDNEFSFETDTRSHMQAVGWATVDLNVANVHANRQSLKRSVQLHNLFLKWNRVGVDSRRQSLSPSNIPVSRFARSNIDDMAVAGMITNAVSQEIVVIWKYPRRGVSNDLHGAYGFDETTMHSSDVPQSVDNPIRGSCLCTMLTRPLPFDPVLFIRIVSHCFSSSRFILESSCVISFLLDR